MEKIILISGFLATGSAWGMAWSGGLGSVKKDMSNAALIKLVSLIFTVAGSICAAYILYELYAQHSNSVPDEPSSLTGYLAGKNLFLNGGKLLIQISPLALILPVLRKSKIVCGLVGICYILLPFYEAIVTPFV